MGLRMKDSFYLTNIIGTSELDSEVYTQRSLAGFPYDILVFDPGQMVGWAAYAGDHCIAVGQGPWHECLSWNAAEVVVERTPYAARRTHDLWPAYYTGFVLANMYPAEPSWVLPTNLKVAQKWFKLPRGHGLGPHAKDALTHLVHILVTRKATE